MKKRVISLILCLLFLCTCTGNALAFQTSTAVSYEKKQVDVGGKTISANVIIVNLSDPDITAKVVLADGKLNNTKTFSAFVDQYDPVAMVNGNFFNAYDQIKDPVGSLMSDGAFVYGVSGLPAMGITSSNQVIFGRPMLFTKISTTDGGTARNWTAFEVNTLDQSGEQSILYTPARGSSVAFTQNGSAMTVQNDAITAYQNVSPGGVLPIPADGYIVYFSTIVNSTNYFHTPEIGRKVAISYTHAQQDPEGFDLQNVRQVLSGAPRLVRGGAIDYTPLEGGFAGDARFESSATPRTAVGKLSDGRLLIVNVSSATIPQLKQLMLNLGATDAINIDGGASTAMYVKGQYVSTPGRALTSVLMIQKSTGGSTGSQFDNINIYVDGKKLVMDQSPLLENGRVLAPVRFIGEALQYDVSWDEATETVNISNGDTHIQLIIGSNVAYKNGQAIPLDVPAKVVGGRTLVPVRFVAESFNAQVSWDQEEPAVIIQSS